MNDLVVKRQNRHQNRLVTPEYQADLLNEKSNPIPNPHYETQDAVMCALPKGCRHPFSLRIINMY
jgi:hypothetical protein